MQEAHSIYARWKRAATPDSLKTFARAAAKAGNSEAQTWLTRKLRGGTPKDIAARKDARGRHKRTGPKTKTPKSKRSGKKN
jgi:hypothetical protein